MANLIMYDSTRETSRQVAMIAGHKYKSATWKDLAGVDLTDIGTYIGTLSNGAYDKIVVAVDNQRVEGGSPVGVEGDVSQANMVSLEAKVSAAPVRDNTATAGAAATITLDAGASTTADYYNGMYILINGGTGDGQARQIIDYSTGRVATVDSNWGTNPSSDSEFIITDDLMSFGRNISDYTPPVVAWEKITELKVPSSLRYIGGKLTTHIYPIDALTATGFAASTLSDTSAFTADAHIGHYVGLKTSSVNGEAGQIRKITENTVTVLTVDKPWDTNMGGTYPSGTVTYQISANKNDILWDLYLTKALDIKFLFAGDTEPLASIQDFVRLFDRYDDIANSKYPLYIDVAYLEELAEYGKSILEGVNGGVVS